MKDVMWWQKKTVAPVPVLRRVPPANPQIEKPGKEDPRMPAQLSSANSNQSRLGASVVLKGELTGKEDLVVEGQVEGLINLQDCCLTVGLRGQVKADIQ